MKNDGKSLELIVWNNGKSWVVKLMQNSRLNSLIWCSSSHEPASPTHISQLGTEKYICTGAGAGEILVLWQEIELTIELIAMTLGNTFFLTQSKHGENDLKLESLCKLRHLPSQRKLFCSLCRVQNKVK